MSHTKSLIAVAVALALTACGGGGGSTASSSTPTAAVTISPNFITTFVAFAGDGLGQISLDPSSTTSTGQTPTSYKIDWGDGQTTISATAVVVQHTYVAPSNGSQYVTLTVTDNAGNSNSIKKNVWLPTNTFVMDGYVQFGIPITNQVVGLQTEVDVPPLPQAVGALGLWPGLQPISASPTYAPLGNGIIQPILAYHNSNIGPACSTETPAESNYGTWWVEGYVWNNTTGCSGGNVMAVSPGDHLKMVISLTGTVWTQVITDVNTGQSVSFAKDMQGQAQNLVDFAIEEKGANTGAGLDHVTYTNTTITLAHSESGNWCVPNAFGSLDYMLAPTISADGKSCALPSITLKPGPKPFHA